MQSPQLLDVIQRITAEFADCSDVAQLGSWADSLLASVEAGGERLQPHLGNAVRILREAGGTAGKASGGREELLGSLGAIQKILAADAVEQDDILACFLDERGDSLDELEDLVTQVQSGIGGSALERILGIIHSIKGDAGVLGFDEISAYCHGVEDVLSTAPAESIADETIKAVEQLRGSFAALTGEQPEAPLEEPSAAPTVEWEVPEPDDLADVDTELVGEFVAESREHLESIDTCLLQLESGTEAERVDAVNGSFRAFHTIKGLSGFLNLNILMRLAHEAEAMLHRVRSEEVQLTPAIINAAFLVNDGLKGLVNQVEAALGTGASIEAPANYGDLVACLGHAATGAGSLPEAAPVKPKKETTPAPGGPVSHTPAAVRSTIKVDSARLDHLVDTIGELVIAEAMVSQCDEMPRDGLARLPGLLNQLDKTTRELQEMAMSLRMVPIRSAFRRMARLARDVAHKLNKPIEFVTRGDDTELDKTVVDVIGDPLVHMVRNAIDHGIEDTPEEREEAGKPAAGRIELRAFHEGGCIHVEIEDDGAGLSRDAILAKARGQGIVGDEGDALSDSEVYGLIFAPGFSTAASVTEVSGRGVGLDVVKKNIEGLRGRVEIRSTPGQGSVFSIRLPLTLAIIDGMVVRVSQRRYIVPTLSIIRMFRPKAAEITSVLERGRLLRVGDDLVSLHRLDEMLGLAKSPAELEDMSAIVVEGGGGNLAFLVDELLGQQQIVIKPLGETLSELRGFAGGAIMPDGTVGLILDITGLTEIASKCNAHSELETTTHAGSE